MEDQIRELLPTGTSFLMSFIYIYKITSVKDQFSDQSYLSHESNWIIWTTDILFMSQCPDVLLI